MENNKYIVSKSRRETPWDGPREYNDLQNFIRAQYKEHYSRSYKSLLLSNEKDFINSKVS